MAGKGKKIAAKKILSAKIVKKWQMKKKKKQNGGKRWKKIPQKNWENVELILKNV